MNFAKLSRTFAWLCTTLLLLMLVAVILVGDALPFVQRVRAAPERAEID